MLVYSDPDGSYMYNENPADAVETLLIPAPPAMRLLVVLPAALVVKLERLK